MYEHKNKPLISRQHFRKRMLNHVLLALTLVGLSLSVGVVGHIYFDDMSFITALVASTTLMSGQGLSVLPESDHRPAVCQPVWHPLWLCLRRHQQHRHRPCSASGFSQVSSG
ncbi:hypothetical protein ACYCFC_07655 [Stutzerimonas sp. NM35]